MKNYQLISLLFETTKDYNQNLERLLSLIQQAPEFSIIVAPEVCLSGYDYENFTEVLKFSIYATQKIKEVSKNKIIILTMIEKDSDAIFNFIKVFHNQNIVYKRAKARLFRFGDEHKYMQEGSDDNIKIITIDGIKIALFICFELRFLELWQKAKGADVIAVSAYWGVLRSEHFKSFTNTLAVMNQCYVVASDSKNEDCTKLSGIITPMGEDYRNNQEDFLMLPFDKNEIKKMRRYMDIGLR